MSDSKTGDKKSELMEELNAENCGEKLKLLKTSLLINNRELAKTLGCSEATISRIESGKTKPTAEFLNKLLALVFIGHSKYNSMSKQERSKILEYTGALGGAGVGAGVALAGASASGAVAGLSTAGVASGLAVVGGAVLGGGAIVASLPAAIGLVSFGVLKGIKSICEANKLDCTEVDGQFEIRKTKNCEDL